MPTNRLSRSIPFWVLVGGSAVATAAGAFVLFSKLGAMDTALTANTATTSDVYVGQIWAIAGAILAGIGLIGLALSLVVAALSSIARPAGVAAVEPLAWEHDDVEITEPADASYAPAATPAVADAPAEHDEPLIATGDDKLEAPRA